MYTQFPMVGTCNDVECKWIIRSAGHNRRLVEDLRSAETAKNNILKRCTTAKVDRLRNLTTG